jgi:hypothetical protein
MKDLLGRDLTATETRLLEAYRSLLALLELDLAPNVAANVREAAASLWQVVNGLALVDERPEL